MTSWEGRELPSTGIVRAIDSHFRKDETEQWIFMSLKINLRSTSCHIVLYTLGLGNWSSYGSIPEMVSISVCVCVCVCSSRTTDWNQEWWFTTIKLPYRSKRQNLSISLNSYLLKTRMGQMKCETLPSGDISLAEEADSTRIRAL